MEVSELSYLYQFLGWILEGIDWVVFHTLGIHNVGICIILFKMICTYNYKYVTVS